MSGARKLGRARPAGCGLQCLWGAESSCRVLSPGPGAGLAARRLRVLMVALPSSVYKAFMILVACLAPCTLSTGHKLRHLIAQPPAHRETEAPAQPSTRYQLMGLGWGPGSILWACHPVSTDLGHSSGQVTLCPWRGEGAKAGAAAAGGSGHQSAHPFGQEFLLPLLWGSKGTRRVERVRAHETYE